MKKFRCAWSVIPLALVAAACFAAPAWGQDEGWPDDTQQWPGDAGIVENVEEAPPAEGPALPMWVPWVLLGVILFLVFIVFVIMVVVMVQKTRQMEAQRRRDRDDFNSRLTSQNQAVSSLKHELETKDDKIRQLEDQLGDAGDEGARIDQNITRVADAKPVLGVLLVDEKTGVTSTCQVHIADASGLITQMPKYTVGTAADCDVCVSEDVVSRKHCNLYADAQGTVYVYDLDSRNGTFIERGGEAMRVEGKAPLKHDDVLVLGSGPTAARLTVIIKSFKAHAPVV